MEHGLKQDISVFDSADKGKWGQGEQKHGALSMGVTHLTTLSVLLRVYKSFSILLTSAESRNFMAEKISTFLCIYKVNYNVFGNWQLEISPSMFLIKPEKK
ncbi:MAG: hypothetical protein AB9834_21680 [Lentimicrobium sp.]